MVSEQPDASTRTLAPRPRPSQAGDAGAGNGIAPEVLRRRRRQLAAAGAAAGDVVATATAAIEELHRSIAGRAFAATPASAPVRAVHDRIAGLTYGSVRLAGRAAGRAAGLAIALSPAATAAALDGPVAGAIQGALSGAFGDRLESAHPALAVPMSVRVAGEDIPCTAPALRSAFPLASARVAVFLHGLCETEVSWGRPALDDDSPGTYGDRLHRHLGHTPVFVRYNSGLHISDNGRRLTALLGALVEAWPVAVEELALIGHSMGGLLMRSACDVGRTDGAPWVPLVRHCVYLGVPHDGAPLERGAHLVACTLRTLGETRPLARLLEARSAGVKDLRFSYLREEDWRGQDQDTAGLIDTGSDLPLLSGARHHVVAATLGRQPTSLLSRLLGDLLVYHGSAHGRGRRGAALEVEERSRLDVGGITHFHLLDHPAIYEQLHEWLLGPRRGDEVVEAGSAG